MIYDCFNFFNEFEILDIRLHELESCVDKFVLVEASKTHQGRDKPLYFDKNKQMFHNYLDKIIHIIVEDSPELSPKGWNIEFFQRDCIMRGLVGCGEDDIIILSDVDEIPRSTVIKNLNFSDMKGMFYTLEQRLHLYYLNTYFENIVWNGSCITNYGTLQNRSPQLFRDWVRDLRPKDMEIELKIKNGGWHFTYLSSIEKMQEKIAGFSHSEFDNKEVNNPDHLSNCVSNLSHYAPNLTLGRMKVEGFSECDLPFYVKENSDKFSKFIRKRISIIISTYNHLEDCLKPCIDSIIQFTDLADVEIIISANGCKDGTMEFVNSLVGSDLPFKLVWNEEPLGCTKAINEGIKVSTGEYIILLNNDIVLLPQRKNTWINQLLHPFKDDPEVGGTGPFLMGTPRFIVFFCACIKREMFDKFGLLDEIFSPGTCEDVDFCAKIQKAGYKIIQVPYETNEYYEYKRMLGGFPMFHKGSETIKDVDPEVTKRNNRIIDERYGIVKENKVITLEDAVKNLEGKPIFLHLGCGDIYLGGWINCDLENDKADVKLDCSKIPLPDNSVQEIYNSHLLEHFDFMKGQDVLAEWYRVLVPGGRLITETPDLLGLCKWYVNSNEQDRVTLYGLLFGCPWMAEWNIHKFLYSETQLRWTLGNIGFTDIVRVIADSHFVPPERTEVFLKLEAIKKPLVQTIDWQSKIAWRHPLSMGWQVFQKPTELIMLSDFLKGNKITRVIEIGAAVGGTTLLWANMVGDNGIVYSIDIKSEPKCYSGSAFEKQIVELIGDSHDSSFKDKVFEIIGDPVDMLFIDGDHSYEGVKEDFYSFLPFVREGGFIVFHDIVDSEYHRERGCFVATFWNEIKNNYKSFEFIDSTSLLHFTPILSMGIGVIIKDV